NAGNGVAKLSPLFSPIAFDGHLAQVYIENRLGVRIHDPNSPTVRIAMLAADWLASSNVRFSRHLRCDFG
ncbi:MAG: hypothetical protein R3E58_14955, partial [Phycisphaerae bacterium]